MKTYSVLQNIQKSKNTFCLRVERPLSVIKAGQCFNVGIPGMDINREYSMYSDANAPYLEFLIRDVNQGMVSSNLRKLTVGDSIEIDGPYGEFCISPNNLNRKFVFIASGTGIAPFHSFVKTYTKLDYTVIHGIRYADETYDSEDYQSGKYIPCISRNHGEASMRVTDYLRHNKLSPDSIIYLCGNRNMIIESVQILLDTGISGDQIVSEVFF